MSRHAPAAYIASIAASTALCKRLDANDREELTRPINQLNAAVEAAQALPSNPRMIRQQQLSTVLDDMEGTALTSEATDEASWAHLRRLQQPGAGCCLLALAAEALGLDIAPQLLRILLRLRLRLPVAATEGYCPLCDGVAEVYGDRARTCPCLKETELEGTIAYDQS